jgi:hypothetical protein
LEASHAGCLNKGGMILRYSHGIPSLYHIQLHEGELPLHHLQLILRYKAFVATGFIDTNTKRNVGC